MLQGIEMLPVRKENEQAIDHVQIRMIKRMCSAQHLSNERT